MKYKLKFELYHEHQPSNLPAEIVLEREDVSPEQAISKSKLELAEVYENYEIVLTDCRPVGEKDFKNEFAGKVSKK